MNAAFVVEPARCTGCEACRVACSVENRVPVVRSWRTVHHANRGHVPGLPSFHLPLACNHCARPACLQACPAAAYARDPATGAVLVDDTRCLGCGYCEWVCPYGAPRLDEMRGVIAKCTFCRDRLVEGAAPACVSACPTGALRIEPRGADAREPELPGVPAVGLGPALRVVGGPLPAPEQAPERAASTELPTVARSASGLREHWSLAVFTSLCIGLFAAFAGWTAGGSSIPPWAFAGLGTAAAAVSLLHLGRPARAWRAVRNLRSSWVSRELATFGAFLAGGTVVRAAGLRGPWAWVVLAAGVAMLLSIDRVYQTAERRRPWRVRAPEALPAGLFLAALLAGHGGVAAAIGAGRLLVPLRGGWLGILQGAGSIAWVLGWALGGSVTSLLPLVLVLELAGRVSFYAGMEARRPRVDLDGARRAWRS